MRQIKGARNSKIALGRNLSKVKSRARGVWTCLKEINRATPIAAAKRNRKYKTANDVNLESKQSKNVRAIARIELEEWNADAFAIIIEKSRNINKRAWVT